MVSISLDNGFAYFGVQSVSKIECKPRARYSSVELPKEIVLTSDIFSKLVGIPSPSSSGTKL